MDFRILRLLRSFLEWFGLVFRGSWSRERSRKVESWVLGDVRV